MKIRRKAIIRQVFLAAFISLSLGGCNLKKEEPKVSPPLTFPLSQSYIGYGVINVSYTRLSSDIDESASTSSATTATGGSSAGYLRQGSVIRIIERRLVKNEEKTEVWALVVSAEGSTKGWIKESLIDIYGNESQAVTASKSIRNEE
jgi:hypothetical protein